MIPKLPPRADVEQSEKLAKEFESMQKLIDALNEKAIPAGIADSISQQLAPLNQPAIPALQYTKMLADTRKSILKQVEKELKLVPQKHYLKTWMALGMSAFGLPFGMVFSMMQKNFAFLGLGLPIGMGIGLGLGAKMDEKAKAEGRQLDLE